METLFSTDAVSVKIDKIHPSHDKIAMTTTALHLNRKDILMSHSVHAWWLLARWQGVSIEWHHYWDLRIENCIKITFGWDSWNFHIDHHYGHHAASWVRQLGWFEDIWTTCEFSMGVEWHQFLLFLRCLWMRHINCRCRHICVFLLCFFVSLFAHNSSYALDIGQR